MINKSTKKTYNTLIWEIVDDYNRYCSEIVEELDDIKKDLILKLICNGQYTEKDIIHVYVHSSFTHGWALTTDSFCLNIDGVKEIIPYSKIRKAQTSQSDNCLEIELENNKTISVSLNVWNKSGNDCFTSGMLTQIAVGGFSDLHQPMAKYLESVKNLLNAKSSS